MKIYENKTIEQLTELDNLLTQYKKKDLEQKFIVVKAYYICLAIGYALIGIVCIFKTLL